MAVGVRHPRALALDRQARRLGCEFDGVIDEIGEFVGEPLGLEFLDARRVLVAGVKPQPGVQQISLPDRFDHRRIGTLELHGCDPSPNVIGT